MHGMQQIHIISIENALFFSHERIVLIQSGYIVNQSINELYLERATHDSIN